MSLRLFVIALALAALALAAPAGAITGGAVDGGHPAVGMLFADRGNGPERACSGTLVAPSVYLTAAHCVAGLASSRVWVSFETTITTTPALLTGTAYFDPRFGHDRGDYHDVAVVVLDRQVAGIAPLALPALGALDAKPAALTAVGYGYWGRTTGGGNPSFAYDGARRFADVRVESVTQTLVHVSSHGGGTCFGDSGGPLLAGSTVVAVTSSGDSTCSGQSRGYRLDTPSARSFLGRFVDLR